MQGHPHQFWITAKGVSMAGLECDQPAALHSKKLGFVMQVGTTCAVTLRY